MDNGLQQIIESMKPTWDKHPNIIFIKDSDLIYRYVNPAFLDLVGNSIDQVLGKDGFEIFNDDPQSSKEFHDADIRVVQQGAVQTYQTTVQRKGIDFYAHTTKTPLYNSKDQIIGIYGESRDISQLINTKIDLKNNLNLIETMMDAVPYPIFVKDLNHKYIRVNKAFADEVQISKLNLYGKTDVEIYGAEKAKLYETKDNEVIQKGKRTIYLSNRKSDSNSQTKFMVIKVPLYDDKEIISGIVGIINPFVDISDIQEQIINQQRIDSISFMAGGIAHDLNNILTSIMGISAMLKQEDLSDAIVSMIETIYSASEDASILIKKLLTFSKKTPAETANIDLVDQISSVIKLISVNLDSKVTILQNFSDDKIEMLANKTQISQLILNLILNSVEAIEKEGTISISIKKVQLNSIKNHEFILLPTRFIAGDYVLITVEDNGIGISEENLNKIFDPFFSTKESGTGLGLPVVYGVISAHSGLLKIVSKLGKGTSFYIYLPLFDTQSLINST